MRWYERAVERSDYAEKILGALAPLLSRCETALDVGAGCGALAVPLAVRMKRVTALEPSLAMAAALRRRAEAEGIDNIDVIEASWGDVALAPHDLVLCAHVGELLRPRSIFLRDCASVARRGVALVRDAGRERDKFFFRELYPVVLGRPYSPGCDEEETIEALAGLGLSPTISVVRYRSDQPFTDLDEACDFWQEYLAVNGTDVRAFLKSFLERRLVPDGSGWLAPYAKEAAVIWWRVERSRGRTSA